MLANKLRRCLVTATSVTKANLDKATTDCFRYLKERKGWYQWTLLYESSGLLSFVVTDWLITLQLMVSRQMLWPSALPARCVYNAAKSVPSPLLVWVCVPSLGGRMVVFGKPGWWTEVCLSWTIVFSAHATAWTRRPHSQVCAHVHVHVHVCVRVCMCWA